MTRWARAWRPPPPRAPRARFTLLALFIPLLLTGCRGPKPAVVPQAPSGSVRQLQREIDRLLARPDLEAGIWGIVVRSLARDETLYSLNARKLLMPASTLKVATLAVAAEKLGWDFVYETRLVAGGPIRDGVLEGDLVVVGGGDPSLTEADGSASRAFSSWADELKALGVRSIAGRLIGDDNRFDDEPLGSGWMWDDLDQGYSAGIGALQLNLNATRLSVWGGPAAGTPASVSLASNGSGLTLRNRVVTGSADSASRVLTRRIAGSAVIDLSGSIAHGAVPIERLVAVDNPTLHFVVELRQALIGHGIEVRGPAVDIDDLSGQPNLQDDATLLAYRSPPLSALALTLMKVSQNQYAETFLKTLGTSKGTATFEGGRAVMRQTLEGWGVRSRDLVLADGSGLSRYNLLTPEALSTVLVHVDRDARLRGPFDASLPVAGRDGTLSSRLTGTPAEGNVRAKTGSLTDARSVAGYVKTADGEPLAFVIIANNYGLPAATVDEVSDAVLTRLASFKRER